jgi:hypothetical protein
VRSACLRDGHYGLCLAVLALSQPFLILLLKVCCWLRRRRVRTFAAFCGGERRGPCQLLLRSQGPRGPIAIACPITTPNQSLRADACNIFLSAPVYGLFLAGAAARSLDGGNDDVSRDNEAEVTRLLSN